MSEMFYEMVCSFLIFRTHVRFRRFFPSPSPLLAPVVEIVLPNALLSYEVLCSFTCVFYGA